MTLPSHVYSHVGLIPVIPKDCVANDDGGWTGAEFDMRQRTVMVDSGSSDAGQLAILGHEIGHVIIWDSGMSQNLTDKQIEQMCDAIGTYIAGAVLAGYLKLTDPRNGTL